MILHKDTKIVITIDGRNTPLKETTIIYFFTIPIYKFTKELTGEKYKG